MLTFADVCSLGAGVWAFGHDVCDVPSPAGLFICVCRSLYMREWVSLYAFVGLFICVNRSLCMRELVSLYAFVACHLPLTSRRSL
jgi:hypothetical protein